VMVAERWFYSDITIFLDSTSSSIKFTVDGDGGPMGAIMSKLIGEESSTIFEWCEPQPFPHPPSDISLDDIQKDVETKISQIEGLIEEKAWSIAGEFICQSSYDEELVAALSDVSKETRWPSIMDRNAVCVRYVQSIIELIKGTEGPGPNDSKHARRCAIFALKKFSEVDHFKMRIIENDEIIKMLCELAIDGTYDNAAMRLAAGSCLEAVCQYASQKSVYPSANDKIIIQAWVNEESIVDLRIKEKMQNVKKALVSLYANPPIWWI